MIHSIIACITFDNYSFLTCSLADSMEEKFILTLAKYASASIRIEVQTFIVLNMWRNIKVLIKIFTSGQKYIYK
jgi:hypothetical protein